MLVFALLSACKPSTCSTPGCAVYCEQHGPPDVAVTLTDFVSGELVVSALGTCLEAPAIPLSGDPIVRVEGGVLYVLDRGGEDTISAFDVDDPRRPLWETALPVGSNPHDLVAFADRLWVPTFNTGVVHVLEPSTGEVLAVVEADGFSEAAPTLDRALVVDGRLWVADQRFAVDARTEGALLELDPDTERFVRAVPVGHNPRIEAANEGLLVATGYYVFEQETAAEDAQDGALFVFDPSTGERDELFREAGEDLHAVVEVEDAVVFVTVDSRVDAGQSGTGIGWSTVRCLVDGQLLEGPSSADWFVDVAAHDGQVLLAQRGLPVGEGGSGTSGLLPLDPRTCTTGELVPTALPPYDLTSL